MKRQIKILFILYLFILPGSVIAKPGDINEITLGSGAELIIEEIQYSRILPHVYYDQAVSSIPGVYPESEIMAKNRFFQLGRGDSRTFNSVVCYKKDNNKEIITISGIATFKTRAWRFETGVSEVLFPDSIIMVLEAISSLP